MAASACRGRGRQLQPGDQGRRGLPRRPRQQGRVPRHPRRTAQAAAQERRRSVRQDAERGHQQEASSTSFSPRATSEAAGVVQGAIEDFAQEFALVIRRFLKLKSWRDTERIVIGGGFRASRVGELAIGRAGVILKADEHRHRARADPQRSRRSRPDRRRASGAVVDAQGPRCHPRGRYRRHQHPRRRRRPQPASAPPICPRPRSGSPSCGGMPTRRR